ncbi:MAG: thioredoxin family protein [Candidatus Eisenbacteria bacterium]
MTGSRGFSAGGTGAPASWALLALLALSALLIGGCGGDADDSRETDSGAVASEDVREAATTETGSELPRLLDLGADKCVPCKAMAPILEEMRETFAGQLEVEFIDVWKARDAGTQYGVKVIPTQIFFDESGNELFRHQGFFSREDMLAKWSELGFTFEE